MFPDGGGEVLRGLTKRRGELGFNSRPNSEPVRTNQTLVAANPGPELGPELAGDIDRVGLEMDEITIINAAKGEATYEDPSEHYTWDPTPIAWDTSEYPKQPRRDCRSGFLGNNRDLLGAGAYGLVYRVEKQRGQDAGKKFAMKMIEDKNMTGPEDNILLDREVAVFKNMITLICARSKTYSTSPANSTSSCR